MKDAPFVPVGRVVKVHGLKGEVSVALSAGPPFSVPENLAVWVVPPPSGPMRCIVESVRQGPKGPLFKLSGIDDRADAEILRGRSLIAHANDLPEGWSDRPPSDVGLRVRDVERGEIGTVVDVIVTGANDVWVTESDRYGEVLIPVIDDVVLEIDDETGTASIRLLPGLIDEEGPQA